MGSGLSYPESTPGARKQARGTKSFQREWRRLRCPHCGTENPGQHRFCGMCGKPLDEAGPQIPPGKSAERVPQGRRDEPAASAPAYTGGILNLGAPAERPGRNLDYLLEDDEPRSHKGLVVGIVALALVAGLGYLRWRGELPWLKLGSLGPKNAAQTAESEKGGAAGDQAGAPGASSAATPDAGQSSNNGAATAVTAPAGTASNATSSAALATPASATGTASAASSAGSGAATVPTPSPAAESKPVAAPPNAGAPAGGEAVAPAPAGEATTPSATATPAPRPAAAPAPAEATPAPAAAPPAKPKAKAKPLAASKPADSVALGERYLYGRGVPQDCTRGLRYVKPAADQSNPRAMITMGALYATGHCLSKDLPTAYRFFALALRKDPGNGALKQNAEMVWAQMTASERQQAIRMTQ